MKWLTGDAAFVRTLFRTCSRISLLWAHELEWERTINKNQNLHDIPVLHSTGIVQYKANPDLTGEQGWSPEVPFQLSPYRLIQISSQDNQNQHTGAHTVHSGHNGSSHLWDENLPIWWRWMGFSPTLSDFICTSEFLYLLYPCSFLETVIGIIQISWQLEQIRIRSSWGWPLLAGEGQIGDKI